MAKITIADILTNFASSVSINARFQQIEDEFNNNVLYRNNPVGEPNVLNNDIDMGGNDILNLGNLLGSATIAAANVGVIPAGNISSVDAQNALEELDAEKAKVAGDATVDFNAKDIIVAGVVDGRDVAIDGIKLDNIESAADVTDAVNVNSAGAIMHTDLVTTEGMLRKTGAETYVTVKSNLSSTTTPSGSDNFAAGYSIGSVWVDTTVSSEAVFTCVGDGLWIQTGTGSGSVTAVTASYPLTVGGTATVPDISKPFRGAMVTTAVATSIAVGPPFTTIPWELAVYDTDNIHDIAVNNSRFTVPTGATYGRFRGMVEMIAQAGLETRLKADGTTNILGTRGPLLQTIQPVLDTGWFDVSSMGYIEVQMNSVDAARAISTVSSDMYMSCEFT